MDKFAETISEKIDSMAERVKNFNLTTIRQFIYGVRAQGEAIPEPTFRTTEAENRPAEFDWYQEFRVGSLCGVNQRIHFGQ
jgi:hypothetical protein